MRDFFVSTRAPYVPLVVLLGGALVVAMVIRLLNSGPSPGETNNPLSGEPVGASDAPVVVVNEPAGAPTGTLSLSVPVGGTDLDVGPGAFPPDGSVVVSVVLPTSDATTVEIRLRRMQDDGSLQAATPITLDVQPDDAGSASATTTVQALTDELGPGIYRVVLRWDGTRIGGADVALGLYQPTNVAIFNDPRQVSFAAGRYVAVQVNARGKQTDAKAYRLPDPSGAPATAYALLNGEPHLFIAKGVWAGYWMPIGDGVTLQ
jgi:hypothetical protein